MTSQEALFKYLLSLVESEMLDFKQIYHEENVDLLHDILCMANARVDTDRYIVFGIDDGGNLIGLDLPCRHTQNDIVMLLRNAHINRSLYNDIKFEEVKHDNKEFLILTIKNRVDKPFFLTQDFSEGKKRIRAGVIYTRNADGNTPKDRTALDDEMELMWRQRFALDDPPLKRFEHYLGAAEDWVKVYNNKSELEYYYKFFPQFRIIENSSDKLIIKDMPEVDRQWLPRTWTLSSDILRAEYFLTDHGSPLANLTVWWGDNMREPIPLPDIKYDPVSLVHYHELSKNSIKYKAVNVIAHISHGNLGEILNRTKVIIID